MTLKKFNPKTVSVNTPNEELLKNIETNIRRQLPQCQPYPVQDDVEVVVVGGGPSMADHIDKIKELVGKGFKLVAVNGSFDYLLDHGLKPSLMIMLDARKFNKRFLDRAEEAPGCKFLLAAQCHPATFDTLEEKGIRPFIFHTGGKDGEEKVLKRWYLSGPGRNYHVILGGSTVILRGIWLLRVLGFTQQHIFGFDSCLIDDKHHSYTQEENDGQEIQRVVCAGREFKCQAWMLSQADDFMHLVKSLGDKFELEVYGDGLINWIIQQGATELIREN
jgi:hypothetical protein